MNTRYNRFRRDKHSRYSYSRYHSFYRINQRHRYSQRRCYSHHKYLHWRSLCIFRYNRDILLHNRSIRFHSSKPLHIHHSYYIRYTNRYLHHSLYIYYSHHRNLRSSCHNAHYKQGRQSHIRSNRFHSNRCLLRNYRKHYNYRTNRRHRRRSCIFRSVRINHRYSLHIPLHTRDKHLYIQCNRYHRHKCNQYNLYRFHSLYRNCLLHLRNLYIHRSYHKLQMAHRWYIFRYIQGKRLHTRCRLHHKYKLLHSRRTYCSLHTNRLHQRNRYSNHNRHIYHRYSFRIVRHNRDRRLYSYHNLHHNHILLHKHHRFRSLNTRFRLPPDNSDR